MTYVDTMTHTLSEADIAVVIGYFVLVIAIGILAMWHTNRNTVSGYFLAGRSMWFLPIGASLFVSNIGTEHFIGLAGSGAAQGISVGAWELNAMMLLQVLGWLFLPVYIACGVCTMPEYLSRRFGGIRLRAYFAFLSLVLYIFTKCSGDLYTGALFIQQALRWDLYLSIVILVLITALLTITGGLTAVIYTDTLQAVLMVGGALFLMAKSFQAVGGFSGLLEKYPQAVPTNVSAIVPNTTCHHPDKMAFQMLRKVDDDYMPWLGFLFGQTPGSVWYWCTDQVIVQRALAARSISHAKGATLVAGFIKVLPLFMMVLPGMVSRILYPNEVACTNPDYCMEVCQSKAGCSNIAYPRLVLGLMPEGARGLMMAVMIAALMSDLDSIFNSASTLFTLDIWKRIRKQAKNTELMVVGRVFICVMVAVSILWVQVIKETQRGQVFIYIQEVTNYLAPPFSAIFFLAIMVPFVNEKGAFWALMLALTTGVVRLFSMLILKGEEHCGSVDTYPEPPILKNFHYMYFSMFITLMTAVVAIVVSLLTGRPPEKCLVRTTFWTRFVDGETRTEELPEEMSDMSDSGKRSENAKLSNNDAVVGVENQHGAENHPQNEANDQLISRNKTPEHNQGFQEPRQKGIRLGKQFLRLFCGVDSDQENEEKMTAMKAHMETISRLKQGRSETIILNSFLILITFIGISMYIFWSSYDFKHAPFYPQNATELLPGDSV